MRHTLVQGIILKKRNLGENDQFITLFCPELGKIEAVAKGARKIQSHFIGHLEPLNICELQLYTSQYRTTITQCQTVRSYKNLHTNFESSIIAQIILEIIQKTVHAAEQGREVFDLLSTTLDILDRNSKKFIHVESFKIKLLTHMGLMPDLKICHHCSQAFTDPCTNDTLTPQTREIHSDPQGHFYCSDCYQHGHKVPFGIIKLIHYLSHANTEEIDKISLTTREKTWLRETTDSFLNPYISSPLNTEKILIGYA